MGSRKPRRPEVNPGRPAAPGAGGGNLRGSAGHGGQAPRSWRPHRSAGGPPSSAADAPDTGPGDLLSAADPEAGQPVTATVLAFPEPPARRRRRRLLIWSVSAVVLFGAFLAFLFFSPALALKTVTVQGNSLLSTEQVQRALEPLLGRPLTTIGDGDVAALLADQPEIAAVDVVAQPPSEIVVTIRERVPVAVLQSGSSFLLIDEDGREIGSAVNRASVRLPLIDGGTEAVNSAVFSTVTSVLSVLSEDVLAKLDHASASTVDSVSLRLLNGQTVFWGSAESNVAKARALEALLQMPPKDPPVTVFDVSTPTVPVTR